MELLIAIFFMVSSLIFINKCHTTSIYLIRKLCKRMDATNIASSVMEKILIDRKLLTTAALTEKSYKESSFEVKWKISLNNLASLGLESSAKFYDLKVIVSWDDEKNERQHIELIGVMIK